jgi:hypothetical protein
LRVGRMSLRRLCVHRSQGDTKEYGEVSEIEVMKSWTDSLDENPKASGVAGYRLFPVEHQPNKYTVPEENPLFALWLRHFSSFCECCDFLTTADTCRSFSVIYTNIGPPLGTAYL